MDSISQTPSPQVTPKPVFQPSKINLMLVGVIVLLLILLTGSFYQVLSLRKQIDQLETVLRLQPTPVATPIATPASTGTGIVTPAPTGGTNEPLELTGTIQRSEVEGGCWFISADSPQCRGEVCSLGLAAPYEPVNLPDELKKIGIKAKFKLEVQSGVATVCQIGPAVKILDYQIIK